MFPSLYCITDANLSPNKNVLQDIKEMCEGGCKIIQLREKNISYNKYLELAKKAKKITQKYGAKLIINDDIKVALNAKADGVHLGQSDGSIKKAQEILPKNAILGISVHSLIEFQKAKEQKPTYIAVGSVFPTKTKKDIKIVGLGLLKKICAQKESTPIVAIGGIDKTNFQQVLNQGADSIAMISAILKSGDIKKAVKEYLEVYNSKIKN